MYGNLGLSSLFFKSDANFPCLKQKTEDQSSRTWRQDPGKQLIMPCLDAHLRHGVVASKGTYSWKANN